MEKDIIIRVEDLYKEYWLGEIDQHSFMDEMFVQRKKKTRPARRKINAINGISFDVMRGEALGIIGGNGAGKSTLLKMLSRVTAPSSGRIYMDGSLSSMLEVGTGFHPELSGRENIYINGTILGMTRKEIDQKIEDIIDFSEVREFIDTPVKRYSSGMYVKLAFAVAAYLESDIMILDEVLAVGDMKFQEKCLDKITELIATKGRTVLFVSHNMASVRKFCQRCIVLEQGKLIFNGDTEDAIHMYFGEQDESVLNMDYRGTNRFTWLTRDDVRLTSATYIDKVDNIYWDDEKMKICFCWFTRSSVNKMGIRFEISDGSKQPVATAVLYDFYTDEAGKESKVTVEVDISMLKEGKYTSVYTLFVINNAGESIDLDCVDGLFFEKRIVNLKKMEWSTKAWGAVELPQMRVIT